MFAKLPDGQILSVPSHNLPTAITFNIGCLILIGSNFGGISFNTVAGAPLPQYTTNSASFYCLSAAIVLL
jgi:hypothetical protein